ncbi:glucosamine 6-phosphate N-acetyltransferase [Piptocephalis cylindrospora]|uniref:Glucosamine 6-phosphate N-acetyltransferase n=1 Tax=Piptocephalis cylindrospora TaxID=1907219 RepID=A0A4V1IXY3_9FUNG|nr:glucosamine 6-phosphate N-acetyltransferase [Piptocephalis cylindrospora]|eukprot:RKP12659.1 glucosamine 6-phosphate N-acetyltransferase [Piptocephalis cylindrospora]
MFNPNLIASASKNALPEGYVLRPLMPTDYAKGFLECLAELAEVGPVKEETFLEQYREMKESGTYYVHVIEDTHRGRVVASATLLIERKFLRGCSKAGHIEDVVVSASERGKRLGVLLITQLRHAAQVLGCYKLLLNCSDKNIGFYEKCGLTQQDVQMKLYLSPPASPEQEPVVAGLASTTQPLTQTS